MAVCQRAGGAYLRTQTAARYLPMLAGALGLLLIGSSINVWAQQLPPAASAPQQPAGTAPYQPTPEERMKASRLGVEMGDRIRAQHPDKALAAYTRAAEIEPTNLVAWRSMAEIYDRLGWPDQAIGPRLKLIELGEQIGTRQSTSMAAEAARTLAVYYLNTSRKAEAEAMYEAALRLYRTVGDRVGQATVYSNLGTLSAMRSDWPSAQDHFWEALALQEALENTHGMAIIYRNLGMVFEERKARISAREMYGQAIDLFEKSGDKPQADAARQALAQLN